MATAEMIIKLGVDFSMLHPWIVRALWHMASEFAEADWGPLRLTSGREGPHGAGSFHVAAPYGLAADVDRLDRFQGEGIPLEGSPLSLARTWEAARLNRITKRIGPLFQLVVEADHYHLEADERALIAAKVGGR